MTRSNQQQTAAETCHLLEKPQPLALFEQSFLRLASLRPILIFCEPHWHPSFFVSRQSKINVDNKSLTHWLETEKTFVHLLNQKYANLNLL